ncbi:hypothetical protein BCR34DRAFT_472350 [Clohesyomyces aquaticus]|uniref:Erythromycin biosynthesis protein CIII-like C-terminal domain-containing protein n=1 Tax=Clohesyomyces aquaticus TaxID=1231657 RepID=A0A1Y2A9E9_9PLEO|nr:hypothetical protein BCR34DRAFT_472350 [Clohesyomyces aquaticus]
MSNFQRILSLGFVPIVALFALQYFSPETFGSFQDAIHPYISNTPLSHFFPDLLPPRQEIPIIISSTTHWSHVEKVAKIALVVAELGYPVTFITGKAHEDHVKNLHPNITFSPMVGHDDKMSEEDIKTWLSLRGLEQELFAMKKVLVDGMPDQQESVQIQFQEFRKKYGNDKPLISMFDQTLSGNLPVILGGLGIIPDANIGISLAPLALQSNDTYPFRWGKTPETGPDARELHFKAWQDYLNEPHTKELNGAWWKKLKEMGAVQENYPDIFHAMNVLPQHLLQFGIPQFEFERSDIRNDIRYFGGFKNVRGQEKVPKLPAWWDDIAQAKKDGKKIVAVSQGTIETDPKMLILPTLEALKDRDDMLVIASFVISEPEDVPNLVVPKNARVAKFVPYNLLLPLTDVLISNGGYGAVQHCMRVGTPMVVSGEGQDKANTNAIVQWSGVGLNLGGRKPGVNKLREGIKAVLETDKYKKKAMAMSREYNKYDISRVVDGKF